jgi:hypothetical protein
LDVGGNGPVFGDDVGRFGGGDWLAVGVADDVGHPAVHHGPGSFGEVRGDDAEGAEVVSDDAGFASLQRRPAGMTNALSCSTPQPMNVARHDDDRTGASATRRPT